MLFPISFAFRSLPFSLSFISRSRVRLEKISTDLHSFLLLPPVAAALPLAIPALPPLPDPPGPHWLSTINDSPKARGGTRRWTKAEDDLLASLVLAEAATPLAIPVTASRVLMWERIVGAFRAGMLAGAGAGAGEGEDQIDEEGGAKVGTAEGQERSPTSVQQRWGKIKAKYEARSTVAKPVAATGTGMILGGRKKAIKRDVEADEEGA